MIEFSPTRAAGLEKLQRFVKDGAGRYARDRNHDRGPEGHPNVSGLSPYIRHRVITEEEVLRAILDHYAPSTVEKFVDEVFWRAYWKGWLEMRPGVWTSYRSGLRAAFDRVQTEAGLRSEWEAACNGDTGLAPFDAWARELVATGYLHNHARMWFASIWIFTLRLPWELGADFFMRHLLDGDPASNTLGWRWVAGLHTPGKTYLARASNITKYTGGRFGAVHGLAKEAVALDGPENPPRTPLPDSDPVDPDLRTGLLLTEDDLSPGWLLNAFADPVATGVLNGTSDRSPLAVAEPVMGFVGGLIADTAERFKGRFGHFDGVLQGEDTSETVCRWAADRDLQQVIAIHAPVGPAADLLDAAGSALNKKGVSLRRIIRPYDKRGWPHATHGFFRFKAKIPKLLDALASDQMGV